MKKQALLIAAMVPAVLSLSGCDKVKSLISGKPKGQVAATVGGREITTIELRAQLGGFNSPNPQVMKAAQQQALQQIIMRDIITQKAKDAKLDKSPQYTVQVRRGEETLLAQLYERKIAQGVAVPSRQDAEAFVGSHPDMFVKRRILILDQVVVGPNKVNPERFKGMKSLAEVKALFTSENVPFQENVATLDSLSTPQQMIDQIGKMPADDIFVVPARGALVFNHVSETRSVPFTGDLAVTYAINVLHNQKIQETVRTQIAAIRQGAESSIVYNAAFKPPPPKPGAPGAPGAANAPAQGAPAAGAAPATPAADAAPPAAAAKK